MNLLLALLLAALTSQPSSQPASPRADERVFDNVPLRFHFAVPKTWKDVSPKAESVIYVFQLPAVGDARKAVPSLVITAADAKGETLEQLIDERRKAIAARNANPTLTTDEATTVAGHDGWTFCYDTTLKLTVTAAGQSHEEKIAVKVRDQLTLIDGRLFELVLSSDDKGLIIRSRLTDRVVSTLAVRP